MNPTIQRFLQTAKGAQSLGEAIRDAIYGGTKLSIAKGQQKELSEFIFAHANELQTRAEKLPEQANVEAIESLLACEYEVEQAIRFIENTFILPRCRPEEQEILASVDWFCTEGYNEFLPDDYSGPVGPLVVIESSLSPMIWGDDAKIPIPSLFSKRPKTYSRNSEADDQALGRFPIICLPGNLVRSPADYPLLSHEVGHAVDTALGITLAMKANPIPTTKFPRKWSRWCREIVADVVGVLLSGNAFLLSFCHFTRYRDLSESLDGRVYPGYSLRLYFIEETLRALNAPISNEVRKTVSDRQSADELSRDDVDLIQSEFCETILPAIFEYLFGNTAEVKERWSKDESKLCNFAKELSEGGPSPILQQDSAKELSSLPFRSLAGMFTTFRTLATETYQIDYAHDLYQNIYEQIFDIRRPEWVDKSSNWNFQNNFRPTLRPTILSEDGIKVPPVQLMVEHEKIVFIGATNGNLASSLRIAFELRNKTPWEEIQIYFADDALLEWVYRENFTANKLRDERDEAEKELAILFKGENKAKSFGLYRFSGLPTFGAFWDWEEEGGRIHVSSQIPGVDIRQCPSSDMIWLDSTPTSDYEKYLGYLERVQSIAKKIPEDGLT